MSSRELIALGTASQAPTRDRNHNGYALRFDEELIFFDPGEGFQRQCTIAGLAIARATAVCITHFHGDHCLGLPGLVARRSLDRPHEPLPIFHPADGEVFYDRLLTCTATDFDVAVVSRPNEVTTEPATIGQVGKLTIEAAALDHRVTAHGYRVSEPSGRRFDPDALGRNRLEGPIVGRLQRDGSVTRDDGETVTIEQVSTVVAGTSVAVVMDTRPCDGARAISDGVDLLLCESTYLDTEKHLADDYRHMTAADAGRLATEAGAGTLVLSHFSARYRNVQPFLAEAGRWFDGPVFALADFDRIDLPVD